MAEKEIAVGKDTKGHTDELGDTGKVKRDNIEIKVDYRPAPLAADEASAKNLPTWRVRIEPADNPAQAFGLDINGDLTFGRVGTAKDFIDLGPFGAETLGVSRKHFTLRPTVSNLLIVDEGSTNGTFRNGRPIGVANPQSLFDRDTIAAGKLQFNIRIIERPRGHTAALRAKADLADVLTETAKAITSQMDLAGILNQVAEAASSLTDAGAAGVWLLDKDTGELHMEARWGIEDEDEERLRRLVADGNPIGRVIRSGELLLETREEDPIKIKTGFLVESLLCVPLKLGPVTFGVLGCVHREVGRRFDLRDEKILSAVADFAAVAVQNARMYKAADDQALQRLRQIEAVNELSLSVSESLDLKQVHRVLMEQIRKHWQIEQASLWLYDNETARLTLFDNNAGGNAAQAAEREIVEAVIEKGKPLLSTELLARKLSPGSDEPIKESTARMDAQSLACVPLMVQGVPVGALALFARRIGAFREEDLDQLQTFANPVATAIANSQLYADTQHKQATVEATVNTLDQPLLILDDNGNIIVANKAANELVEGHMAQVFDGLSQGIGRTVEIQVNPNTYLTTSQHVEGVGTILIMQDISYVKKLETARGEFVQALSHDLKSPLASIKGWAYLLPQVSPLDERGKLFVERISAASDNVLGMLTQLLDIALLSESPRMDHRPTDLEFEVNKALRSVEGAALAKNQMIKLENVGEPYLIKGDPMRLYRSVLNLLDNAIKYAPEATEILVRVMYSKDAVRVAVRDDGEGIPEKDLPRIFEQYFRGEQERSTQPGIGLGLALVQSTARVHGGSVTVDNVQGHGAEFTLTLPGSLRTDTSPLAPKSPAE